MPSNPRLTRLPLAVLACLALMLAAVAGGASSAQAANCKPPKYPYGGYFTGGTFTATKVSCTYGRKLLLAYQRCRTHAGKVPAGHCTTRVMNFRCTESARIDNAVEGRPATEFDARVTCRRGGTQRVVHTYSQNLDE